jgi:hypothetical protein
MNFPEFNIQKNQVLYVFIFLFIISFIYVVAFSPGQEPPNHTEPNSTIIEDLNTIIIEDLNITVIHDQNNQSKPLKLSKLKVVGNQIVNETGSPVYLRGVNRPIGNYVWGRIIAEQDFKDISEVWYANIVRLPFKYDQYFNDPEYRVFIDDCVNWAEKYNLYIILDAHEVWHDGNQPIPPYENRFTEMWINIAEDYQNKSHVLFGLFNEPHHEGDDLWYPMAKRLIKAIRDTGAENLILVSGIGYGFDGTDLAQVNGTNIVYEFHTYLYHQKSAYVNGINNTLEKMGWTKLSESAPIFMGEVGVWEDNSDELEWFDRILTEAEARGWHYTTWAYFGAGFGFDHLEEDWTTRTPSGNVAYAHIKQNKYIKNE